MDDDRNILTSVSILLESDGFDVSAFSDPQQALAHLTQGSSDLAVLDLSMPRMDGMSMLQRLRQHSDLPVIFLTSRTDEVDEAMGLRLGADDYVTKPFSPRLLLERIRAVLRRHVAPDTPPAASDTGAILVHGALRIDPSCHAVSWNGRDVALTVTEFLLLQALAQRPGMVKSRDQLMDAAYDDQIYVDDRTIDSHIKRLRKKLRGVDPAFDAIETLYGLGYRLAAG